MTRSLSHLRGWGILATDGRVGHVHDFYFDDSTWLIRYLVVDTGEWLRGRKVLISPAAAGAPDLSKRAIPVDLARERIEKSPPIALDKPVSRQEEENLRAHFGWQPYWTDKTFTARQPERIWSDAGRDEHADEADSPAVGMHRDPHLRSVQEILGYRIAAEDGLIGHVVDFLVNDEIWGLISLVVRTRSWLPGRKVLLPLLWITGIDWTDRTVGVDLTREHVRSSAEWKPEEPVNEETEQRLYDSLGRPVESR